MPRFFFNVSDGLDLIDEDGHEFASIAAAKCEAITYAGRLICDLSKEFWNKDDWQLTVTDEAGVTVFSLVLAGFDAPAYGASRAALSPVRTRLVQNA